MQRFLNEAPKEPAPRHLPSETTVTLISAVLLLAAAALDFSNRNPSYGKWLLTFVVFALLYPVGRLIWKKWQVWSQKRGERAIQAEAAKTLAALVKDFQVFVGDHSTAPFYIAKQAQQNNIGIFSTSSYLAADYIREWYSSFTEQLKYPAGSLDEFVSDVRQFTRIVSSFKIDYFDRLEEALRTRASFNPAYIDQLEAAREEFNAFLRTLQQWVKPLSEQYVGVRNNSRSLDLPYTYFEKVRSFKPTKAANPQ